MTMAADPALEDEVEAPDEGAGTGPEPSENEADPAAALAARIDAIEAQVGRLNGLDPAAVRSALGRISSLQSAVDDIGKRDPAATLDPRVTAGENALVAVAETLLDDMPATDPRRTALSAAIRGVEQARSQREIERREAALEERVRAAITPSVSDPAPESTAESRATAAVLRRATALGIDHQTLPWAEFWAKSDGSLEDAVAVATEWLQEHRVDAPATRVSARRAAAGAGAPARSGGEQTKPLDYADLKKMGAV